MNVQPRRRASSALPPFDSAHARRTVRGGRTAPALGVALTVLTALACETPIQGGLAERDANELVAVLAANDIAARKSPERGKKPTWSVAVASGQATAATQLMAELRLPRRRPLTTQEVVSESSLVESPSAERLKHLEGLEGDLEQSLETMDGVVSAAVELVVPAPQRGNAQPAPSKASVLVRALPPAAERLRSRRVDIQALVAASVDGLGPAEVVLVVDEVTRAPPLERPASPPGSEGAAKHWLLVGLASAVAACGVAAALRRRRHGPSRKRSPELPPIPGHEAEVQVQGSALSCLEPRGALPEGAPRPAPGPEGAPVRRAETVTSTKAGAVPSTATDPGRPRPPGPVISPAVLASRS